MNLRNIQVGCTRLARCLSESNNKFIKTALIAVVKNMYNIDMSSASTDDFESFDDFFTRDFKPGVRPIANAGIVHPVDGMISSFGKLDRQHNIFIKHKPYTKDELLADGANFLSPDSNYISYYLAPYNHHQIYMPANGKIVKTIYIPGLLHSVKPGKKNSEAIVDYKNERLILMLETEFGPLIIVMVGALLVGSMSTAWGQRYTPNANLDVRHNLVSHEFSKGDAIGRFHYGSSVILITEKELGTINCDQKYKCLMGEAIWK